MRPMLRPGYWLIGRPLLADRRPVGFGSSRRPLCLRRASVWLDGDLDPLGPLIGRGLERAQQTETTRLAGPVCVSPIHGAAAGVSRETVQPHCANTYSRSRHSYG